MNLRNRVQLIGNLGVDPKMKKFESGKLMARFTLATTNVRKVDGKFIKDTQWHNITAWDKNASIVEDNLTKGSEVVIQGRVVNNVYKDKDGITRKASEIIAESLLYRNIKSASEKTNSEESKKSA